MSWSAQDDVTVWEVLGHLPRTGGGNLRSNREVNALVKDLAQRFSRTDGAIRSRLKHLDDPSHAAYIRLNAAGAPPAKRHAPAVCHPPPPKSHVSSHAYYCKSDHAAGPSQAGSQSTAPLAVASPATTTAAAGTAPADLNAGQRSTYAAALSGRNVFITGPAGTGKSFLLRCIIDALEAQYPGGGVAVCASTGIAASHINGSTIHSWAGIGLGKGGTAKLVEKVLGNSATTGRWRAVRSLVVDEVSMLDGELFTALSEIGRAVRGNPRPFGGVQLVLSGDFFQLPPVSLSYAGFAFQSPAWTASGVATQQLSEVVRQQGDATFVALLNEVHVGVCSAATAAALGACHARVKPRPTDGIEPTRLYCKNADVDAENATHLRALPGAPTRFCASDAFKRAPTDEAERKKLVDAVEKKAPATLELKLDAQVILTKNWAELGLVNGSRGVVTGFRREHVSEGSGLSYGVAPGEFTVPVVRFDSGVLAAVRPATTFQAMSGGAVVRTQVPLKLAWALTVHKSQGMTLSRCELQLEDAFAPGQVYVALSRVTSLAGLWLVGGAITQACVSAHPAVLSFYRREA